MLQNKFQNHGLLEEPWRNGKDWIFGKYSGILGDVLTDGQWDEWLPVKEVQKNAYFDTYACISFATCNAVEILIKRRWGTEYNFSDRGLAKMSGTGQYGNSMSRVTDTVWREGLLLEDTWPNDLDVLRNQSSYLCRIPNKVLDTRKNFQETFKYNWDWVSENRPNSIIEALKYSPLTISVRAWGRTYKGIYQRISGRPNHVITLYGFKWGEYWKVYDHYAEDHKKLAWNFDIWHIQRHNLQLLKDTLMPKYSIDNNTLVFCVEGKGEFGLALDGKIIVDDLAKVQAQWLMRNNGDIKGKTKSVTMEVWESFPKINLKKEPV